MTWRLPLLPPVFTTDISLIFIFLIKIDLIVFIFQKVLLVGSANFTVIGQPILSPHFVRVEGIVIEKTLSQTQMDYWYAPKKKKVGARHHRKYFFTKKKQKLNYFPVLLS